MNLGAGDWTAIRLSIGLAALTVAILLAIGTPLAWWLARTPSRWKVPVGALVAMPIVLPPTVLGFYLLVAMGPHGPIGELTSALGLGTLAFTFPGLVVASVIYSLPFVVQPVRNAFEAIGDGPLNAAAALRAGPLDRFFTVALPLARPGLISGAVLGFAHTIGEFGIVLMIGGNIPGRTQVVSMLIYNHVEAMEYGQAHRLAAGLLLFSFLVLLAVYSLGNGPTERVRPGR